MLMGAVLKTDDGGDNWFPVLAPSEPPAFVGLALSRDTILYASGSTGEPKRLLFYRSSNEGLSWDTIAHTNKLTNGVNELLVLQNEGVDNIFFGTWGDGVFSYANVITAVDDATGRTVPSAFSLRQNYPNPFNSETIIRFNVARSSHVKINVFDTLGRRVQTIVETYLTPGQYSIKFASRSLSTGVYFYRMNADGFVDTKKFVLVR